MSLLDNTEVLEILLRLVENGLFPMVRVASVILSVLVSVLFGWLGVLSFVEMSGASGGTNFRERQTLIRKTIGFFFASGLSAAGGGVVIKVLGDSFFPQARASAVISGHEMQLAERSASGAIFGILAAVGFLTAVVTVFKVPTAVSERKYMPIISGFVTAAMLWHARALWESMINSFF